MIVVHPSALQPGTTRAEVEYAMGHAVRTIATGNRPTRVLVLGPTLTGELIEVSAVIRPEDFLVVHAGHARSEYRSLDDSESRWGVSVDGVTLTAALLAELAMQADHGYDLEKLRVRLRPGPTAPLSVGEPIRVALGPDIRDTVMRIADEEGIAVHEIVRAALREYLA